MTPLADAAPTGAGLAIVGLILLAFFAIVVGVTVLVIVLIVKSVRRRKREARTMPPGWTPSG